MQWMKNQCSITRILQSWTRMRKIREFLSPTSLQKAFTSALQAAQLQGHPVQPGEMAKANHFRVSAGNPSSQLE